MSTVDNLLKPTIGDRLRSDRSWFAAVCARGAELVLAATRVPPEMPIPMTTAEAGGAMSFPPVEPTREEIKAAKLAKAKLVLHRGKTVNECVLTVKCPRHGIDFVCEVSISYGFDSWFLKAVPKGCDGDDHDFTSDERHILTELVDDAYAAACASGVIK